MNIHVVLGQVRPQTSTTYAVNEVCNLHSSVTNLIIDMGPQFTALWLTCSTVTPRDGLARLLLTQA